MVFSTRLARVSGFLALGGCAFTGPFIRTARLNSKNRQNSG